MDKASAAHHTGAEPEQLLAQVDTMASLISELDMDNEERAIANEKRVRKRKLELWLSKTMDLQNEIVRPFRKTLRKIRVTNAEEICK